MIFQYNNVPSALLPIIEERLKTVEDLFPTWCHKVVIEYESPTPPDYEVTCNSEYAYRFIVLTISEEFFREDHWQDTLIHEIYHSIAAPFTTQSWMVVETIVDDGPTRKYLETQLRQAEEAFATDAARLIDTILKKKVDKPKKSVV
jgi:hypothetical protein